MTTTGSDRPKSATQESFPDDDRREGMSTESSTDSINHYSRQMLSRLSQVIEGDIIPRLMLALDTKDSAQERTNALRLGENVDEFVQILLAHDASIAVRYVSTMRADGIPLSALYLDLLAPAARRLGELWEEDECSFTDVTIGVCRMNQVLLEFSRCFDATKHAVTAGRNALVIPVPGEQHTFGILMVMEFMRRGGWNCYTGTPSNSREFQKLVRSQDFDAIGISVSADKHVDTARKLITEIRNGARNADCVILAGGRVFIDDPELADTIGADASAADGEQAVAKLHRLCQVVKHSSAN